MREPGVAGDAAAGRPVAGFLVGLVAGASSFALACWALWRVWLLIRGTGAAFEAGMSLGGGLIDLYDGLHNLGIVFRASK